MDKPVESDNNDPEKAYNISELQANVNLDNPNNNGSVAIVVTNTPGIANSLPSQIHPDNIMAQQSTNEDGPNNLKKKIAPELHIYKYRYCNTCKIMRPPMSSHCSDCDNCVKEFDHHCLFVGNCVGQRNIKYFMLFLFYVTCFAMYSFGCSIAVLIDIIHNSPTISNNLNNDYGLIIAGVCCIVLPFLFMQGRICEHIKYIVILSGFAILAIDFDMASSGVTKSYYQNPAFALVFIPISFPFVLWLFPTFCMNLWNVSEGMTKKEKAVLERQIRSRQILQKMTASEKLSNVIEFLTRKQISSDIPGIC